jgi:hypothetical protein
MIKAGENHGSPGVDGVFETVAGLLATPQNPRKSLRKDLPA